MRPTAYFCFSVLMLAAIALMQSVTATPKNLRSCFAMDRLEPVKTNGRIFVLATAANVGDLTETANDARSFVSTVREYYGGIPDAHICLLDNVYRQELVNALKHMQQFVNKNDLVIIYFSGHGSYLEDQDKDESEDGDDEVLVTYDMADISREQLRKYATDDISLRDDDFVALVNTLDTDKIWTVIDACFAEGIYLDPSSMPVILKSKMLVWGPFGTAKPKKRGLSSTSNFIQNRHAMQESKQPLKGRLWYAAGEYQMAYEIKYPLGFIGRWLSLSKAEGGLFTLKLVEQMQKYPDKSLDYIFEKIQASIEDYSDQAPMPDQIGNW